MPVFAPMHGGWQFYQEFPSPDCYQTSRSRENSGLTLVELREVFDQDRVAELEEETEGYTFLNAAISYRFFLRMTVHELTLRGTNLTDQLARSHTSPLKELAPLPGRDISLAYKVLF